MKMFQGNRYFLPDIETLEVGEEILSAFDIHTIDPITLLLQTGYLTIKSVKKRFEKAFLTLQFPNFEVRTFYKEHLKGTSNNSVSY